MSWWGLSTKPSKTFCKSFPRAWRCHVDYKGRYADTSHNIIVNSSSKGNRSMGRDVAGISKSKERTVGGGQGGVKTLDIAETLVLGAAVVSHTMSIRTTGDQNISGGGAPARQQQQFLSGCILVSLVLRKLVSGLYEKRRESSPTSQAMLRLRNAESSIEDQVKVLDVVLREVDSLKTRSRLMGRDVKSTMKQIEGTNTLTRDVLRETNTRMELLEGKVGDMEGLIGSVHDVVSKQLNLIRDVIQEQRNLDARVNSVGQGQDAAKQTISSNLERENILENSVTADPQGTKTPTQEKTTNYSTHISSSIEDVQTTGMDLSESTDEWGRKQPTISVSPQESAVRQNSKDGSILFSFDSN